MKKRFTPVALAFALALALPLAGFAQQTPAKAAPKEQAPARDMQARVFQVTNLAPEELVKALQPLSSDGRQGAPMMVANNSTMTITVRDFPENIAAIESVLKLLDKPRVFPPRAITSTSEPVDVQISLIAASNDEGFKESPAPAVLAPVVEQLKKTLSFKRFRFITTFTQRVRQSTASIQGASGSIADPFAIGVAGERPAAYEYKLASPSVTLYESGTPRASVQLDFTLALSRVANQARVDAGMETPSIDTQRISISTGLVFREGEQVVVGTTSAGVGDKSIIVVLTMARVKM